ncbi:hypothetical protein QJS66_07470 [Kocuria rhizophila]|nr:hypothetical protein QJS66_07470 [Kocuria rhizophila]
MPRATVPLIALITGKAYRAGVHRDGLQELQRGIDLAWRRQMGDDGVGGRRWNPLRQDLKAAEENSKEPHPALRTKLASSWRRTSFNPYQAAELGYVTPVVSLPDRERVGQGAARGLADKRASQPARAPGTLWHAGGGPTCRDAAPGPTRRSRAAHAVQWMPATPRWPRCRTPRLGADHCSPVTGGNPVRGAGPGGRPGRRCPSRRTPATRAVHRAAGPQTPARPTACGPAAGRGRWSAAGAVEGASSITPCPKGPADARVLNHLRPGSAPSQEGLLTGTCPPAGACHPDRSWTCRGRRQQVRRVGSGGDDY